jgi:methyltransferase family protein
MFLLEDEMKMGRGCNLSEHLIKLEKFHNRPLFILETGTIRNISSNYHFGDGWSTLYIAQFVKNATLKHSFFSIDLKTDVCEHFLRSKGLIDYVNLIKNDSRQAIKKLDEEFDFVYLDSRNNADLVYEEYKLVLSKCRSDTLIIVDDFNANKPKKIIPDLQKKGVLYQIEGNHLVFNAPV